jgi:hypothetical protein
MSFDATITYGAAETPLVVSGTVLPEGAAPVAVQIRVKLPREQGTNRHSVRMESAEGVALNVLGYHLLAASATPVIEVEALTGDFAHALDVQAHLADGQIMRGMCPMGCTVELEPVSKATPPLS